MNNYYIYGAAAEAVLVESLSPQKRMLGTVANEWTDRPRGDRLMIVHALEYQLLTELGKRDPDWEHYLGSRPVILLHEGELDLVSLPYMDRIVSWTLRVDQLGDLPSLVSPRQLWRSWWKLPFTHRHAGELTTKSTFNDYFLSEGELYRLQAEFACATRVNDAIRLFAMFLEELGNWDEAVEAMRQLRKHPFDKPVQLLSN